MRDFILIESKNFLKRLGLKRTGFLKVISLLLLGALFFENLSYANPDLKPIRWSIAQDTSMQWARAALKGLPRSVAVLEDAWKAQPRGSGPSLTKLIYLIQDAHTNESGQLNLAKTLNYLLSSESRDGGSEKYVFVEAAQGDNSLSFLRNLSSKDKRQEIASSYLKKGLVHGAEYLDLTSEKNFTIWGVEDMESYKMSLEAYRAVVKDRQKFREYLSKIESTIIVLKPKIYNSLLLSFDEKYQKYRKEQISLTDYFDCLVLESQKADVALSSFPHLKMLQILKHKESKIDFRKANEEQEKALQRLSTEDKREIEELVSNIRNAPSPLGSDDKEKKAFYALLEEKLKQQVRSSEVRADEFPNLFKYFEYLKLSHELEAKGVLADVKNLEEKLFGAFIITPDEKNLLKCSKVLALLKKLFDLTLDPQEFAEYQALSKDFTIDHLTGFLNKKIMDFKDYFDKVVFLEPGYDTIVKRSEEFYSLTYERDLHFIQKSLDKMNEASQSEAILVTGGFHTTNLKSLLKQKGISYISVTPQILNQTNHKRYEEILLKQRFGESTNAPQLSIRSGAQHLDFLYWMTQYNLGMPEAKAFVSQLSRQKDGPLVDSGGVGAQGGRGARMAAGYDTELYRAPALSQRTAAAIVDIFTAIRPIIDHQPELANQIMNKSIEELVQKDPSVDLEHVGVIIQTLDLDITNHPSASHQKFVDDSIRMLKQPPIPLRLSLINLFATSYARALKPDFLENADDQALEERFNLVIGLAATIDEKLKDLVEEFFTIMTASTQTKPVSEDGSNPVKRMDEISRFINANYLLPAGMLLILQGGATNSKDGLPADPLLYMFDSLDSLQRIDLNGKKIWVLFANKVVTPLKPRSGEGFYAPTHDAIVVDMELARKVAQNFAGAFDPAFREKVTPESRDLIDRFNRHWFTTSYQNVAVEDQEPLDLTADEFEAMDHLVLELNKRVWGGALTQSPLDPQTAVTDAKKLIVFIHEWTHAAIHAMGLRGRYPTAGPGKMTDELLTFLTKFTVVHRFSDAFLMSLISHIGSLILQTAADHAYREINQGSVLDVILPGLELGRKSNASERIRALIAHSSEILALTPVSLAALAGEYIFKTIGLKPEWVYQFSVEYPLADAIRAHQTNPAVAPKVPLPVQAVTTLKAVDILKEDLETQKKQWINRVNKRIENELPAALGSLIDRKQWDARLTVIADLPNEKDVVSEKVSQGVTKRKGPKLKRAAVQQITAIILDEKSLSGARLADIYKRLVEEGISTDVDSKFVSFYRAAEALNPVFNLRLLHEFYYRLKDEYERNHTSYRLVQKEGAFHVFTSSGSIDMDSAKDIDYFKSAWGIEKYDKWHQTRLNKSPLLAKWEFFGIKGAYSEVESIMHDIKDRHFVTLDYTEKIYVPESHAVLAQMHLWFGDKILKEIVSGEPEESRPRVLKFADFYPSISGGVQTIDSKREVFVTVNFDRRISLIILNRMFRLQAHYGDLTKKDPWRNVEGEWVDDYGESVRFRVVLPRDAKDYTFKVSPDGVHWVWMGDVQTGPNIHVEGHSFYKTAAAEKQSIANVRRFHLGGELIRYDEGDIPLIEAKVEAGTRKLGDVDSRVDMGNKEIGFVKLKKLGLRHPPGIVLSEGLVKAILETNDEGAKIYTRLLQKKIREMGVGDVVSVRSNPKQSMPGILKTEEEVRVSEESLLWAIRSVAYAWGSERAKKQRKEQGMADSYDLPIIMQSWVSGRRGPDTTKLCGAGVFSTRNPNTGEDGLFGQFLEDGVGSDLMSGRKNGVSVTSLEQKAPEIYAQILDAKQKLEGELERPQEVEFVVKDEELFFLQTRRLIFAPRGEAFYLQELLKRRQISEARAIPQLENLQKRLGLRQQYRIKSGTAVTSLVRALASTPGAFQGFLAWTPERAKELMDEGHPLIFVSTKENREWILYRIFDYPKSALITAYGNDSSHEAVLTRLSGIPSLINLQGVQWQIPGKDDAGIVLPDGRVLREGDKVVIDGDANRLFISEEAVLEESHEAEDASYGIHIPTYRKEFLERYLSPDGAIKEEYSEAFLKKLNEEAQSEYEVLSRGDDKRAAFMADLRKHFLHELWNQRSRESGKQINAILYLRNAPTVLREGKKGLDEGLPGSVAPTAMEVDGEFYEKDTKGQAGDFERIKALGGKASADERFLGITRVVEKINPDFDLGLLYEAYLAQEARFGQREYSEDGTKRRLVIIDERHYDPGIPYWYATDPKGPVSNRIVYDDPLVIYLRERMGIEPCFIFEEEFTLSIVGHSWQLEDRTYRKTLFAPNEYGDFVQLYLLAGDAVMKRLLFNEPDYGQLLVDFVSFVSDQARSQMKYTTIGASEMASHAEARIDSAAHFILVSNEDLRESFRVSEELAAALRQNPELYKKAALFYFQDRGAKPLVSGIDLTPEEAMRYLGKAQMFLSSGARLAGQNPFGEVHDDLGGFAGELKDTLKDNLALKRHLPLNLAIRQQIKTLLKKIRAAQGYFAPGHEKTAHFLLIEVWLASHDLEAFIVRYFKDAQETDLGVLMGDFRRIRIPELWHILSTWGRIAGFHWAWQVHAKLAGLHLEASLTPLGMVGVPNLEISYEEWILSNVLRELKATYRIPWYRRLLDFFTDDRMLSYLAAKGLIALRRTEPTVQVEDMLKRWIDFIQEQLRPTFLLDDAIRQERKPEFAAEPEGLFSRTHFHLNYLLGLSYSGARLAVTRHSTASPAVWEPTGSRLADANKPKRLDVDERGLRGGFLAPDDKRLAEDLAAAISAHMKSYQSSQKLSVTELIPGETLDDVSEWVAEGLYKMKSDSLADRVKDGILPGPLHKAIARRRAVSRIAAPVMREFAVRLFRATQDYRRYLTQRQMRLFAKHLFLYENVRRMAKAAGLDEGEVVAFFVKNPRDPFFAVERFRSDVARLERRYAAEITAKKLGRGTILHFVRGYPEKPERAIDQFLAEMSRLELEYSHELAAGKITPSTLAYIASRYVKKPDKAIKRFLSQLDELKVEFRADIEGGNLAPHIVYELVRRNIADLQAARDSIRVFASKVSEVVKAQRRALGERKLTIATIRDTLLNDRGAWDRAEPQILYTVSAPDFSGRRYPLKSSMTTTISRLRQIGSEVNFQSPGRKIIHGNPAELMLEVSVLLGRLEKELTREKFSVRRQAARHIRILSRQAGLNQSDLSARSGIGSSQLYSVLKPDRSYAPVRETYLRMAAAFGVPLNEFAPGLSINPEFDHSLILESALRDGRRVFGKLLWLAGEAYRLSYVGVSHRAGVAHGTLSHTALGRAELAVPSVRKVALAVKELAKRQTPLAVWHSLEEEKLHEQVRLTDETIGAEIRRRRTDPKNFFTFEELASRSGVSGISSYEKGYAASRSEKPLTLIARALGATLKELEGPARSSIAEENRFKQNLDAKRARSAKSLAEFRGRKKISFPQLSKNTRLQGKPGLSHGALHLLEKGGMKMTPQHAAVAAEALGVPAGDLWPANDLVEIRFEKSGARLAIEDESNLSDTNADPEKLKREVQLVKFLTRIYKSPAKKKEAVQLLDRLDRKFSVSALYTYESMLDLISYELISASGARMAKTGGPLKGDPVQEAKKKIRFYENVIKIKENEIGKLNPFAPNFQNDKEEKEKKIEEYHQKLKAAQRDLKNAESGNSSSGARLAATRPSTASPAVREPAGSRLAEEAKAHGEALDHLILELSRTISAKELRKRFSVLFNDKDTARFKVVPVKVRGEVVRVDLFLKKEEGDRLVRSVVNPSQKLRSIRTEAQKKVHDDLTAQGVVTLFRLSRMNADMTFEVKETSFTMGHVLPVGAFSDIQDDTLNKKYTTQIKILIEQIFHAHKNYQKDVFFIQGTDSLNAAQKRILDIWISAANATLGGEFVKIGEPDENFQGIVVRYVAADTVQVLPSQDGRTLMVPVVGLKADSALGWYEVISLGRDLGNVFGLSFSDNKIDFTKATAQDLENGRRFFNSRSKKEASDSSEFKELISGAMKLAHFKEFGFSLPLVQKVEVDLLVQTAKLLLKAVGVAA